MRIGTGYDVHRLETGRSLILGGVNIPFAMGLKGHSDADVLVHAICDALLGAAAMGDIGQHFPDSDPAYKDADSLLLLAEVGKKLKQRNYSIVNIDSTIVAQRPRLAGYLDGMRAHIAQALDLNPEQVSVKATTTEGLGFEGKQEGISAQAVALIE
ncbi:MAG TPA: 2-C-methyl-D-erythritol 2,4-cyclodiphosphate synthase [Syntrophomonas sp.]|nr:2-C-methyl-D-erythritol 2,4-cyclodiphosphate synthase [Syntrophomonas sp.]